MAKKAETAVQQSIRESLEAMVGGFWWKVHGGMFQRAGIGDLCGCAFGFYFNIEVKTPQDTKGASRLQKDTIREVKKNGGCAFVVTTPKSAVRKVKHWLLNIAPCSDDYRETIRETLKNKAIQEAGRGVKTSAKKGQLRVVHAAEDWEDHYRSKGRSREVAKKVSPSRIGSRAKKRSIRVGPPDQ